MKVSEFIETLKTAPPDAEVYTSIDGEGNDYKYVVEVSLYTAEDVASDPDGEIGVPVPEDYESGDYVIIWPV